jgi:amidase
VMTSVAGNAAELWRMSATELAGATTSRHVSSLEVVEAHLRRIEAVNPLINAVTVVLGEQALQAAKAADGAAAGGEQLPPFHGVPFTVKDNIDVAGAATTQGARALAAAYPSRDAPVVERLKAAGAIPIGRTNLPTYGVGWVCESELYGATVNPWGPVEDTGRLQRRRGGGAGRRHEPAGAGQRRLRVAAVAGPMLRHRGAEAHLGPHPARGHHRLDRYADRRATA